MRSVDVVSYVLKRMDGGGGDGDGDGRRWHIQQHP